jgi:plasmid stabilization system protein ParE
LIELTPEAERQLAGLRDHYVKLDRPEALANLADALVGAGRRIEQQPGEGQSAPRPYPAVARRGRAWIKAGSYWIAYSTASPPVIVGVFHESADIPNRI